MKKTLLLSAAVLLSVIALAQDHVQSLSTQNPWNDRPDVIIKGQELKNFPGGQLTEMLLGRLPGLGLTDAKETTVTFIVDGFVWPSIDALNINNIEEVAYYRGGLNSKFGVQNTNSNGVLYITTKTAKFNQPLSATVNTLLGTNILKKENGKDHTTLQSYHVALAQGLDRFSWRATAGYNKNTRNLNRFDFTHQLQLNGDVRFSPLKWLDLGIDVNYAPSKGDSPIEKEPFRLSEQQSKYKQDNWNGLFYVKAEPLKGLVNETRVLKSSILSDNDLYRLFDSYNGMRRYSKDLNKGSYKNFAILNDLSYRFSVNKDRIKFKTAALFQYNDEKFRTDLRQASYDSNMGWDIAADNISTNDSWIQFRTKMYTFAGDLSVNFYDILSLQGGVRRDHYKGDAGRDFYSPYYYADLNLKNLLLKDIGALNEVLLFGSYGQYRSEIEISNQTATAPTGGIVQGAGTFYGNSNTNYDKMRVQSYGLKTRFFDRVSLSGDWYRNDNYIYSLQVASFGSYVLLFPIENSGWRVWTSAEIFRNSKFKWDAGLNVFKNRVKIGEPLDSQYIVINSVAVSTSAIQAGMQQGFSYANFSLNMNAAAYFNHPVYKVENLAGRPTVKMEKSTLINLNYLSFGYNFKDQIAGAALKNLNVSFVGRNLVQKKKLVEDDVFSKTVGIALNASF